MNEVQETISSVVKVTKKGIKISWWLIVVAVVIFGAVAFSIYSQQESKNANVLQKSKPDTTEEIKIKQKMSSLRGDMNRYFTSKKTYVGWAPSDVDAQAIKGMGAELKTVLSQDKYMVYAKMPSSKVTFCMDNNGTPGFTGELNKIGSKTCK
jgi:uncharacterized protein HemX